VLSSAGPSSSGRNTLGEYFCIIIIYVLVCLLQCLVAIIRKHSSWSFGSLDQHRICTYHFRSGAGRFCFRLRYCYCKRNVARMGEGREYKVCFNVRIAVCLAATFSWIYLSAICLFSSTSPTVDRVEF